MTVTERLQGAVLFFLFAAICGLFGRSVILESRGRALTPEAKPIVVVGGSATKHPSVSSDANRTETSSDETKQAVHH